MAAPKKADAGEAKEPRLSLSLATDDELQEGEWQALPCGIEALLAPRNTQGFFRIQQAQFRKYGGRSAGELSDVKPGRRFECLCAITAKANFLAFRAPKTKETEVEINGTVYKDCFEDRLKMLVAFPTIREEVSQAVVALSDDLEEETEEAVKN